MQERNDLSIWPRPAEQIALPLMAAFGAKAAEFGLGLDALGGDGDAEALAEADDRTDYRLRLAVCGDVADERLVDLDLVEWKAAQVAQARIAGAEIVHRDPHPE